ncbi:nicotine oxidase [Apiospora marii]|uniref:nicotine oxidase n=1 Tax=Apiospora marii TaxID=335849 RepID=UPI00312F5364
MQAAASLSAPATPSSQCCNALKESSLGDRVFLPDGAAYTERLDTYWSVSAALEPWCMVMPANTEEASEVIKILAKNECPFGIRGGGHGADAYSNGIDEGVTIDFGLMNATTYDADRKIVSIQPGTHWQPVYDTLSPLGVTVTGGRGGTVGASGFISGGGNSFHSASHGFAADNVQNFEVVLGDGRIVNANAEENADLWQAMKGGSGNFGLITRYDMFAIEFPDPASTDIWGGIVIYDVAEQEAVIDSYVKFAENSGKDQNSTSIVYWGYIPALGGMMLNVALENTINEVAPAAFDDYLKTPGIVSKTLRSAPMAEITMELGSGQPAGFRNIWYTGAYDNDARIIKFAVEKHASMVAELEKIMSEDSGFNTLCMFQPISPNMVQHGLERGGNIMGLEERVFGNAEGSGPGKTGVMFLATFAVKGAENEQKAAPLVKDWQDSIDAYADSLGVNWNWRFLNYANHNQNPLASFGDRAVAKMRAVSAKYDPDQVFQKLRRTGHKIPV